MSAIRDDKGRFVPGAISNPKGRTPIAQGGKPNDPHNLRAIIAERADQVITSMIDQAIAGDTTAGDKILQYILPKLQAVAVQADDRDSLPIMKVISAIQEANEALEHQDSDSAADDSAADVQSDSDKDNEE